MGELEGMRSRNPEEASFDECDPMKSSILECSLRANADVGAFFGIRHTERFPFSAGALHHAIGAALFLNSSRFPFSSTRQVDTDTAQVVFSVLLPAATVVMTYKMAIRRVIENDRVVTMWVSDVELEGGMSVRLKEEGWSIAEAVPASEASAEPPILVMRNVVHITPEVSAAADIDEQRRRASEMMVLVLSAYQWFVSVVNQSHEDVMVREM